MRFVAISDTHGRQPHLPDGDVLIHAGDLCSLGLESEFVKGINWLAHHPHKCKILVPGNHDRFPHDFTQAALSRCEDRGIELLINTRARDVVPYIFGSPVTLAYGKVRAFMWSRTELDDFWRIRSALATDILVTHGPPVGIFDDGAGCPALGMAVAGIRPKVHIFGHIHVGHGGRLIKKWGDGTKTLFANVAYLNENNKPSGDPILVFDENGSILDA